MSSAIWGKPWFSPKKLSVNGRLLWFYMTSCAENTGAGIFQYDPDVLMLKTGPWRSGQWDRAVAGLATHVEFYQANWAWVVGYIRHNYEKGVNPDQRLGIERIVAAAPAELQEDFWQCYGCLRGEGKIILPVALDFIRGGGSPGGTPPRTGGERGGGIIRPLPGRGRAQAVKTSRRKPPAADCPWCKWRREHLDQPIPKGARFRMQRFHDLHRPRFGDCLMVTGKEQSLLQRAVGRYSEERVLRWWGDFLRQESKIGHSLAVFCSSAVLARMAEADPAGKAEAMKEREAEMLAETARLRAQG